MGRIVKTTMDQVRKSTQERSSGGALQKFEKAGEALLEKEKELKKKKGGEVIPESAPVNPLAPEVKTRRHRKKVCPTLYNYFTF